MSYETRPAPLTVYVTLPPEEERMSMLDAQAKGLIACDGLIAIPMWIQEGKDPYTQRAISWGPDGKPLTSADIWRIWSLLGFDLSLRQDLNPALQMLCKMVNTLVESTLNNQAGQSAEPAPALVAPAPPSGRIILPGG